MPLNVYGVNATRTLYVDMDSALTGCCWISYLWCNKVLQLCMMQGCYSSISSISVATLQPSMMLTRYVPVCSQLWPSHTTLVVPDWFYNDMARHQDLITGSWDHRDSILPEADGMRNRLLLLTCCPCNKLHQRTGSILHIAWSLHPKPVL